MRHIRRIGLAMVPAIATVLAMAAPAAAQYPPGPNVRGTDVVAPEPTLAFTGEDLAPLFWAVALLVIGLVLLFAGKRASASADG